MTPALPYQDFLRRKIKVADSFGFDVPIESIHAALYPHQRDIVHYALRGGRRAIFGQFGLGKTLMQLETMEKIRVHTGKPVLIGLPLGVKQEFLKDAKILGYAVRYVREQSEITDPAIYLSNYERIRDGKFDPSLFGGVSFDEASVIRSMGTQTTQYILTHFKDVRFRYVFTATPSPNEYHELLKYADFLGIMDISQALNRFFKRDSVKAHNSTLLEHRERDFWLWVHSWAVFATKPSDINQDYSDAGYDLPEMQVRYCEVKVKERSQAEDRDGNPVMFTDPTKDLSSAAREKRESLRDRVRMMEQILADHPDDHFIIWHHFEAERIAIENALPSKRFHHWREFKDGVKAGVELYERHYSAREMVDRTLFVGPGEKLVLLTEANDALFVWRKFIDDSGQTGVNCAVFRNEGELLSSDLISEAVNIAWKRWPGERLYTFVDAAKIASSNPGYCFVESGWSKCGRTKGGLHILECIPSEEQTRDAGIKIGVTNQLRSVYGAQSQEEKERNLIDFSEGCFQYLATKPEIAGSGCNFQYHCHKAIFLGIDYKFNDFIQAIHRIYRFQQSQPVEIFILYSDTELPILKALKAKWARHNVMVERMVEIIREYGLNKTTLNVDKGRAFSVTRKEVKGDSFASVHNDSVQECASMEDNSVGLFVSSIPFSDLFEYSESYNDMGQSNGDDEFFEHMDYLTPHLLRVLQPGRIAAIHVKDCIKYSYQNGAGFTTLNPFSDKVAAHFMKHGFYLTGRITVTTDVVQENAQTYRLGWSEQCKDGSKMSVGLPEYVLLFRKAPTDGINAYADEPVVKSKDQYTRARWQLDAHAFWKSNGDRFLSSAELRRYGLDRVMRMWKDYDAANTYDHAQHVSACEELDRAGKLPVKFMALPPQSRTDWVWDDILRINTLNVSQQAAKKIKHVCPLQIDIVDRLITRFSNPGDLVADPFAGIGTVPVRAITLQRKALGIELSEIYWQDSCGYLKGAEYKMRLPELF